METLQDLTGAIELAPMMGAMLAVSLAVVGVKVLLQGVKVILLFIDRATAPAETPDQYEDEPEQCGDCGEYFLQTKGRIRAVCFECQELEPR